LFTVRNEIRSIVHAVVFLGLSRIRALAVDIAMRHYSIGPDQATYRKCWLHGLACAVVSAELADGYGIREEDAYTAGLLHDIGRIGLLKAYSTEYIAVLKTDYEKLPESLMLEQCLLNIDHCQSGSFLGKVWAFPRSLQAVAEHHHAAADSRGGGLTNLIRVACALADAMGFAEVNYKQENGVDGALQPLGNTARDQFVKRLPVVEKQIQDRITYSLSA